MNELARPFVRVWEYAGYQGGFAGQMFLIVAIVMLIVGGLTWFSNRK